MSLEVIKRELSRDAYWSGRLAAVVNGDQAFSVHLGIFVQPYLEYVLTGRKTIESRFAAVRCAPYGRVSKGDVLILKESGGPVRGICEIGDTWYYRLDPGSWKDIRREFAEALCAQDPGFWETRKHATYATLMQVRRPRSIAATRWSKSDRRGWVVVAQGANSPEFEWS